MYRHIRILSIFRRWKMYDTGEWDCLKYRFHIFKKIPINMCLGRILEEIRAYFFVLQWLDEYWETS